MSQIGTDASQLQRLAEVWHSPLTTVAVAKIVMNVLYPINAASLTSWQDVSALVILESQRPHSCVIISEGLNSPLQTIMFAFILTLSVASCMRYLPLLVVDHCLGTDYDLSSILIDLKTGNSRLQICTTSRLSHMYGLIYHAYLSMDA